jgi:hypothetical protein
VEPKRILLACGDAGIELKQMRWNRWNTAKAKGEGQGVHPELRPELR